MLSSTRSTQVVAPTRFGVPAFANARPRQLLRAQRTGVLTRADALQNMINSLSGDDSTGNQHCNNIHHVPQADSVVQRSSLTRLLQRS